MKKNWSVEILFKSRFIVFLHMLPFDIFLISSKLFGEKLVSEHLLSTG